MVIWDPILETELCQRIGLYVTTVHLHTRDTATLTASTDGAEDGVQQTPLWDSLAWSFQHLVISVQIYSVTGLVHEDTLDPDDNFKFGDQMFWSIAGRVRRLRDLICDPDPAELVSPPDSDRPTWTPPQRCRRCTGWWKSDPWGY